MHAAGTIAGAGLLNPKARGIAPGEKILLRVNNFAGDTKAKISYDGGRSYEYISQVKSFYSTFLRLSKGAKTMRETKIRLSDAEGYVLVNRIHLPLQDNRRSCSTPLIFATWAVENSRGKRWLAARSTRC